jgi:fatty-acid desaturase
MTTATIEPKSAGLAWGPLLWIGGLHVGALLAFFPACFSWSALAVCIFLHWLTASIGICMTYHRLLTHRSFTIRLRWLEYPLTALGCCASEGGAIGWVADHRRHHAHADEELDVHSPRRGFGWAHLLWWMTPDVTSIHSDHYYTDWAPDLERDPVHRMLDRFHFLFPPLMGAGLYAIGGLPWLVWGGFVRSVLVLHTTWLVNSATHIWGTRAHPTRDTSTNLWWVALLAYGEGWHNNHHAFPTSARHGLRWWQIDMTYWAIHLLSRARLVGGIKLPRTPPAWLAPAPEAAIPERRSEQNAPSIATPRPESAKVAIDRSRASDVNSRLDQVCVGGVASPNPQTDPRELESASTIRLLSSAGSVE